MLELAKKLLDEGDCTLVVAKGGIANKYCNRGVDDLVCLIDAHPEFINGASVADKVIGKAAASLMIHGGVKEVFSKVMTADAKTLFDNAGIPAAFAQHADYVENRDKTGRCPLDTICRNLTDVEEMVGAIRKFLSERKSLSPII